MNMKTLFVVLVIFAVILGGAWAVYWKWSSDMEVEEVHAELIDFKVERPYFIATAKGLTSLEIIGMPTGTGIGEADQVSIGKAMLERTESDGTERWVLPIPSQPLLVSEITAKGIRNNAPVGTKSLPYVGATEIYNALWGNTDGSSRITWVDSGQTFVFGVDAQFSLELNEKQYPKANLACRPQGIVGVVDQEEGTSPTSSDEELYRVDFKTLKGGECTLSSGDFSIHVVVTKDLEKKLIYTNRTNDFLLGYHARDVVADTQEDLFTGRSKVRIVLARNNFTGTNLSEASVSVGVSQNAATLKSCTVAQQEEAQKGTVKLNGKEFSVFEGSDAAAGNRYETRSYRAVIDTTCYEIRQLVHYGVVENYEPGAVRAFDISEVHTQLEEIAQTFELMKK